MIAKITKAYIRTYADSGQTKAYVEWIGDDGEPGRTEGPRSNPHMAALFARAEREGITITRETWG